MRLTQTVGLVVLGGLSFIAQAADINPPQVEQRCREQYAKVTNTPESSINVKYAGRDESGRHVVKGTVTTGGKEQPIQCLFGDPEKTADAPSKK